MTLQRMSVNWSWLDSSRGNNPASVWFEVQMPLDLSQYKSQSFQCQEKSSKSVFLHDFCIASYNESHLQHMRANHRGGETLGYLKHYESLNLMNEILRNNVSELEIRNMFNYLEIKV